jgi:hypothetical protein
VVLHNDEDAVIGDDEGEAIGDVNDHENLPLIGSLILSPFDRENLPPRLIACVSMSLRLV